MHCLEQTVQVQTGDAACDTLEADNKAWSAICQLCLKLDKGGILREKGIT